MTPVSQMGSVLFLAALFEITLCVDAFVKAADDGPSAHVTAILVEDLDEVPGSWLWHGPLQTIVSILGVNQYGIFLSFFPSSSLFLSSSSIFDTFHLPLSLSCSDSAI